MEIIINDQPLNFTLEQEKTIDDIIKAVEKWLSSSNLVLTSVKLKGQDILSQPVSEWNSIPLSEVDKLTMTARHIHELRIANLRTILEYLNLLETSINTKGKKNQEELVQGFPYMAESIKKHFMEELEQELTFLDSIINNISEEPSQNTIAIIQKVKKCVNERLRELDNPGIALKTLTNDLSACIEEISDVSLLLQTGKDLQAMESIIRFTELSQSLIRIFSSTKDSLEADNVRIGGKSVEVFYNELNSVLKELIEAFNLKDTVLIGDLLEYEIAPRLENIKTFAQGL